MSKTVRNRVTLPVEVDLVAEQRRILRNAAWSALLCAVVITTFCWLLPGSSSRPRRWPNASPSQSKPTLFFIPAAVLLFGIGRIAFLKGYPKGAGARSFGMATTALPTAAAFVWAMYLIGRDLLS